MAIDTKLMTAEELAEMGPDEGISELIRGELVRMPPPGFEHAAIVACLTELLRAHARRHRLGVVLGNGGFKIERDPDTVLASDVAFISHARIGESSAPRVGYPNIAPELVVEVVSPSDLAENVDRKISIYLKSGVQMVVAVWPRDHKLTVMFPDRAQIALFEGDDLNLEKVISGLSIPVKDIFE